MIKIKLPIVPTEHPCRHNHNETKTPSKIPHPSPTSTKAVLLSQGLCKFGLYEVFKVGYNGLLDEETAYTYRTFVYLAASASAEFFADIALSPLEAAKVR